MDGVSVLFLGDEPQFCDIQTRLSAEKQEHPMVLHKGGNLEKDVIIFSIDLILLAVASSDSIAGDILEIKKHAAEIPVIILGETVVVAKAVNFLQTGVQDVLLWQQISAESLSRSILYAIERQKVLIKLKRAALFDGLTGLYNRRGFMNLAGHYVKAAQRLRQGMLLFYADLDNLKQINDQLGHQAGDQAIMVTASVFKNFFRSTDIVARIGGDEFVALALNTDKRFAQHVLKRLQEQNADNNFQYPCKLSIGVSYSDPEHPSTIESLLSQADKNMYEQKRKHKACGKGEHFG